MERVRKTKIICTIGPQSESEATIRALVLAGMNVARLNFSHDTHANHLTRIKAIRKVSEECNTPVAILLDTKGPEIRSGIIKGGGKIELREGCHVILTNQEVVTDPEAPEPVHLSVSYYDLPACVSAGEHIYIADGLIDLEVAARDTTSLRCIVRSGGIIGSHKNINVPGVVLPFPIVSERDKDDIRFAVQHRVDFIAASFVRSAEDIFAIRHCMGYSEDIPRIIAKIENQEGVDNIDEIIHASYGVMVARGDLGVQLALEHIPLVQKRLIEKCTAANSPVITATQLLESMTRNPRPTRAEMSDVANAIFDGTDALMLSAETASGAYPVESVVTLDRLARAVEHSAEFRRHSERFISRVSEQVQGGAEATARAAYVMAREVAASAIVVPSLRGNSPRLLGRFRAPQPIIAITTSQQVMRRSQLHWGIVALQGNPAPRTTDIIQNAIDLATARGYIAPGEWVVTAAGLPLDSPLPFNTVTSHYLGVIVARGREAIGSSCTGVARLLPHTAYNPELNPDTRTPPIAVVPQLSTEHIPILPKVCGIISERRALITHTQLRAHNPTIVMIEQVPKACTRISEGQTLILNGFDKTIYKG